MEMIHNGLLAPKFCTNYSNTQFIIIATDKEIDI